MSFLYQKESNILTMKDKKLRQKGFYTNRPSSQEFPGGPGVRTRYFDCWGLVRKLRSASHVAQAAQGKKNVLSSSGLLTELSHFSMLASLCST